MATADNDPIGALRQKERNPMNTQPQAALEDVLSLTVRDIISMTDAHKSTLFRHTNQLPDGRAVCVVLGLGDVGLVLHQYAVAFAGDTERAFYKVNGEQSKTRAERIRDIVSSIEDPDQGAVDVFNDMAKYVAWLEAQLGIPEGDRLEAFVAREVKS
jgi:hypothetical protein